MTTFVSSSAVIWPTGSRRRRNGYELMNCSQNSVPATKKEPCISQMWTYWLL